MDKSACMWGLCAKVDLQPGEFITEYVGEVLTRQESDQRGKIYDDPLIGQFYLFDLNQV